VALNPSTSTQTHFFALVSVAVSVWNAPLRPAHDDDDDDDDDDLLEG
jgi:hypothetical protein